MTDAVWTVRCATVDNERDCADLAALRYEWRAVERGERGATIEEFAASLRAWWRTHAATHDAVVAAVDDEAVAMAWLATVERVPGPSSPVRRCGYLQSVYVLPRWRDRGVGHDLVAALVARATSRGLDYVAVHPSERSFPFYRRLGFAATDRVLELDFRSPATP